VDTHVGFICESFPALVREPKQNYSVFPARSLTPKPLNRRVQDVQVCLIYKNFYIICGDVDVVQLRLSI